jgi:hypothetical protein
MRKTLSALLLVFLLNGFNLVLPSVAVFAQTQETLTNQAVIDMIKSGFSEVVIIAKIRSSKNYFDTSTLALQNLKNSGATDTVMLAILSPLSPNAENNASVVNDPNLPVLPAEIILPDKTPVKLRLMRELSSADALVGENVDFEVVEDVKISAVVVIKRDAIAIATVTNARPKRRLGRSGKLDVVLNSVQLASGEKVALSASREARGTGRVGAMTGGLVATGLLFFPAAPLFLFMKGKNISIPKGTEITGYINGETVLNTRKFSQKL